jgi:CheY-like chemotaxis protein
MSLKIMIVDNEPLSLKVMRALAVPLGHRVLAIEDSQEAFEKADKQQFDVVFVGLPPPDGLQLTRRMGNSQFSKNAPVVVLTASDDIQILRDAFGAGATFVLPKPLAAGRIIPMLTAMESPGWKSRRHTARLPLFTEVNCKWGDRDFSMQSRNISESGMLLQSSQVVEVGQEVLLEFEIAPVGATVNARARITRNDGTEQLVGIEFIELTLENQNAIQLYVMGRLNIPNAPEAHPDYPSTLWHS